MKIIQITQGYSVMVDDEDYDGLMKNKWCYHGGYAVRGQRKGKTNRLIRMHAQIMGTPKGMVTDHINRNRLDNRRENLRIVTQQYNSLNTRMSKNNTSGYRGVHHVGKGSRKRNKLWAAVIKVNYKTIFLGDFSTPEEAALAYNNAAAKYFGEYATLNDLTKKHDTI